MSTVQSQLAGDLEEKKLIIILIWHFYENHQKETFVLIAYAGIFVQIMNHLFKIKIQKTSLYCYIIVFHSTNLKNATAKPKKKALKENIISEKKTEKGKVSV